MTEDTELLREIRDLLKVGVELKRAQLNALRVPLGPEAEHKKYFKRHLSAIPCDGPCICPEVPVEDSSSGKQNADGPRVPTVGTQEPEVGPEKVFCERCQTWNYRAHIHTEIP